MAVRRGLFTAALLVALLGASAAFAKVTEAPVGPDPVVTKWPSWPYETRCGDLEFDPVAAFSGPTGVERGTRPSERALARVLKEQRSWAYPALPARHWRLLAETTDVAEFASGRLTEPYGPDVVSFERRGGRWREIGSSDSCDPTSIVDGFSAVTWTLPLNKPKPESEDRHLWINLGPGPCNGGRSQNAQARQPVVWRVDRKLMVAMTLRPLPPGLYTCQGLIEPPLKVRLPEPIGDARLFDGATYPPGNVTKIWRDARRETRAARR